MDRDKTDHPLKEVFEGLFTLLEGIETQNAAVFEFLKDQGTATEEALAPYLERAASASSVKWRAARARMEYLLAPALGKATESPSPKGAQNPEAEAKAVALKDVPSTGARDSAPGGAETKSADEQGAGSRARDGEPTDKSKTRELGSSTESGAGGDRSKPAGDDRDREAKAKPQVAGAGPGEQNK